MSRLLPINLFIRQALLYPLSSPFLPPENKVEDGYSYGAGRLEGSLVSVPPYGIPKTGQTVSHDTGDDGDLEIGKPDTPPRFTDNADGTITDNATGLIWAKDGDDAGCNNGSTIAWQAALAYANALDFAGHQDWRLPNAYELYSICRQGSEHSAPRINTAFFTNTKIALYWSSTDYAYDSDRRLYVEFNYGRIGATYPAGTNYIRCVRGPV